MNFSQDSASSGRHAVPADETGTVIPKVSSNSIDWIRILLVFFVLVFLVVWGYRTVYNVAWNDVERSDYTVYRAAGQAVLDGANIYDAHNIRGWYYVYPPPFAVLTVPFAKLTPAWGSGLWYGLSLLALASALVMSVRLAGGLFPQALRNNGLWTLYELPVLLASPWLFSGLLRCQASEFMVWLVIAAVYLWWRGWHALGGLSLAAAALIKAFPIALLAYFVWQKQWRFTAAVFLGLVLGGVILPQMVYGWQKNLDYWQQWGSIVAGPALSASKSLDRNAHAAGLFDQLLDAQKPRNQSLEALLLSLKVPQERSKQALAAIGLGMLAAMAWIAKRATGKNQLIVVASFLTWNLLIPPISETHYFGLLLVPFAVLTAIALGCADRISRQLAILVLSICFILTLWTNLDKDMEYRRLLCWASLGIWSILLVLAYRLAGRESDHPVAG